MSDSEFELGDWRVQPHLNTLCRGSQRVRIEPRYMNLLVHLAQRDGEVVSADEILSQVWPGLVVGEQSVYQAIARLRKALGDSATHPRYIETVAKRGYRLIAQPDQGPRSADGRGAVRQEPRGRFGAVLSRLWRSRPIAVVIVLATILALIWGAAILLNEPRYDAVAVLRFENLSDSKEDGFFAEGLATELISALGHLEHPRVLGQASSFSIDTNTSASSEIGRLLGVDAFVTGSVRRSDQALRIFVEIVDTRSGLQVWSATYESALNEVFTIQHEIARQVTEEISGRLETGQTDRLAPVVPADLDAYDFYLLGQYYRSRRSEVFLRRALSLYQQAVTLDPAYAPAHRGIGLSELLLSYYGHAQLAAAEQIARPSLERALELDPDDAETLAALGLARYLLGEYAIAEHLLGEALAIKPSLAEAWMWRGLVLEQQGQLREALAAHRQARMLDPLGVGVAIAEAIALGNGGEPEQALERLTSLVEIEQKSTQLFRNLADQALLRGDLIQAYEWAQLAINTDDSDPPANAMQALIFAYLDRPLLAHEAAEQATVIGYPGQRSRELLELTYWSLGDAEGLNSIAEDHAAGGHRQTSPEIEWRRRRALSGMSLLLRGEMQSAAEAFENALEGRDDAIVAFDYDQIYCTSLAFAHQAAGDQESAARWSHQCRKSIRKASSNGWQSHWLDYASARQAALDGENEIAIGKIKALVENGFLGFGLLENDPVLHPLREQPAFREIIQQLHTHAEEARLKLQ